MGLPTLIKQLYNQSIGGTAPGGAGSATGDISQMVKYLVAAPLGSGKLASGIGAHVYPANAGGTGLTSGAGAWTKGSYSQIVASTAQAEYLWGVFVRAQDLQVEYEVDIATGGAGAESIKSSLPFFAPSVGGTAHPHSMFFHLPFIAIPTTTRIAARLSDSTGSGNLTIRLLMIKQSDLAAF